jgi:hypothetical protein
MIAIFDRLSVERYNQNPNHFFFLGQHVETLIG